MNLDNTYSTEFYQNYNFFDLRYCNWQKDLFHGVLPHQQYGETAVAQWDFADIIRRRKSPLRPLKPVKVSEIILQSKFKVLQERNKL